MILDEAAVHALLRMEDLIPAMAGALADLSAGKVVQPMRVMLPVSEHQGFLGIMPAYACARGAELVVVATTSQTPVLQGAWLAPGAHVNAVGAPRPTWRELDDEVLRKSRLYVESRAAATSESGDVIAAGHVFAEIGEVVRSVKPGRESASEITLFKSVGVAVEDVVTADLVYRKARTAAAT